MTEESEWIDISIPLHDSMVQGPMEPLTPHIEFILHRKKGNPVNMYQININSHNGTHIDAPLHFFYGGGSIDEMPLDTTIGRTRVIEIKDKESIKQEELEAHDIQPGERILFKTQNSLRCYKTDELVEDYISFSIEAAHFLADKKVSVVGIDYIAIGNINNWENLFEVHNTLLGKGVWVLEGINLSGVEAGPCELICLPLRLEGGDASPARVIVRPLFLGCPPSLPHS